jgi:hypothetical protein
MSVAGEAVTRIYYTSALRYSYFNGCSTGGREGLMEAQRYPADYNGIAAGVSAINWTKFIPSEIWPELVMNESGGFMNIAWWHKLSAPTRASGPAAPPAAGSASAWGR